MLRSQKYIIISISGFRYVSMRSQSSWKKFATVDPWTLGDKEPHKVLNLVSGKWKNSSSFISVVDPLNGKAMLSVPDTSVPETKEFVASLNKCSKSGLHNPLKNPERYVEYGAISARAAALMREPDVLDFLIKLIQRVAPKSRVQAEGEVVVTRRFLENFSGDQVRYLAKSFGVSGDHEGQTSTGLRWPYGPVTIIAPFNFPLEIPLLQLMGALYMGNKVLLKCDSRVSVVMEQMLRLLHFCGLPVEDVDFLNCDGPVMHKLLLEAQPRMTQFTGSSKIAEILAKDLHGKIRLEDAGFDWKILGPDVHEVDFVAYTSDQDAYAFSGQKCSAQSIMFIHENWEKAGFVSKIKVLAERRKLEDLTIGPILTVTNTRFQQHIDALLKIPGAKIAFGGDYLQDHSIPSIYGSFRPTAVEVPLHEFLKPGTFELCNTEIFGAFQVLVQYKDCEIDLVLEALERMNQHLTAAVVSNDLYFRNKILAHTVNGTTYCGIRARTTGAPQNHWFGPAGDPRGAGIGTSEAIRLVWSCHREIILDEGPVKKNWTLPECS